MAECRGNDVDGSGRRSTEIIINEGWVEQEDRQIVVGQTRDRRKQEEGASMGAERH